MADGVDIDLYSDDIDQNFSQMKVCAADYFYGFLIADMFLSCHIIFMNVACLFMLIFVSLMLVLLTEANFIDVFDF